MSKPSNWPLGSSSSRLVSPVVIRKELEQHPLTANCFPLAIGHYEDAVGHSMRRKRHDDNIIIHCLDGQGWLETPHWEGNVAAGQVILLPRGVPHHYASSEDAPWSIDWCHFAGLQADEYLFNMDYLQEQPVKSLGALPQLQAQFRLLLNTASAGYNLKTMIHAANILKQLLTHIGSILNESASKQHRQFDLDRMQSFMLQNLDKALSLDDLAAVANLSKYHFSKKYQQVAGYSPIRHFLSMKIEYASYLLETSELSIQEIALRVGYDDSLYFSRLFKKITGHAPRQHRQTQKNGKDAPKRDAKK